MPNLPSLLRLSIDPKDKSCRLCRCLCQSQPSDRPAGSGAGTCSCRTLYDGRAYNERIFRHLQGHPEKHSWISQEALLSWVQDLGNHDGFLPWRYRLNSDVIALTPVGYQR